MDGRNSFRRQFRLALHATLFVCDKLLGPTLAAKEQPFGEQATHTSQSKPFP
jgi:hypothetical protein